MTPAQLASKNTESGHQKAVFAYCAMAYLHGWLAADDPSSYVAPGWKGPSNPVKELRWLHAIPNGGLRDPATAARMKAEGVKRGVFDIFLPKPIGKRHGLYIEMKTSMGVASGEQKEFANYCIDNAYAIAICRSWQEAIQEINLYLQGK